MTEKVTRAEKKFAAGLARLVDEELLDFFVNRLDFLTNEEAGEYWDFLIALKKAIQGTAGE